MSRITTKEPREDAYVTHKRLHLSGKQFSFKTVAKGAKDRRRVIIISPIPTRMRTLSSRSLIRGKLAARKGERLKSWIVDFAERKTTPSTRNKLTPQRVTVMADNLTMVHPVDVSIDNNDLKFTPFLGTDIKIGTKLIRLIEGVGPWVTWGPKGEVEQPEHKRSLEELAERARARSRNVEESSIALPSPDEFSSLREYLENLDCSLLVDRLRPHADFFIGAAERARKRAGLV